MKKELLFISLALILLALPLAACAQPAPTPAPSPAPEAAPEKPTWKAIGYMNAAVQKDSTEYLELIELINHRAGGELFIEYTGGPEVVPIGEMVEALRKGVVDMLYIFGAAYTSLVPEITLLSLSEMSPAGTHLLDEELKPGGVYDYIRAAHEREGMFFLGRGDSQYTSSLLLKEKIERAADIGKLTILGGGSLHKYFLEALGCAVVHGMQGDVYNSIERGLTDGWAPLKFSSGLQLKYYEVAKYIVQPPYKSNSNVDIIVNLDSWRKLPKNVQDLVHNTHVEVWHKTEYADLGRNQKPLKALLAHGMEIINIQDDELDYWTNLYNESAKIELQKKVSPEVYNEILRLAKH